MGPAAMPATLAPPPRGVRRTLPTTHGLPSPCTDRRGHPVWPPPLVPPAGSHAPCGMDALHDLPASLCLSNQSTLDLRKTGQSYMFHGAVPYIPGLFSHFLFVVCVLAHIHKLHPSSISAEHLLCCA